MSKAVCPYLCALDANNQPQLPIDYPSFENFCQTTSDELLLLADQATFCLSGEHRGCPRFVELPTATAARQVMPTRTPIPTPAALAGDLFSEGLADLTTPTSELLEEERASDRRRWAWVGAAVIFATVLLCGGSWAAYVGWQVVSERALAARPNRIETLPTAAATQAFIVQTATSTMAPTPLATATALVVTQAPPLVQPAFPVAVTPTPIVVQIDVGQAVVAVAPVTGTQLISEESPPNIELPTPVINLQLEIPPRRPTPVFDLPTSTPGPSEPTPTPTPTVVLGTPVVLFAPLKKELAQGECTLLRWNVENVRAVYYDNQGVNGKGEDEECMDDQAIISTLLVVLGDGSQKTYTTTIELLPPTATPVPTATFTPEVTPPTNTPTWTPEATPTPNVVYGVNLENVGDSQRACSPGDDNCEFKLLVTNKGNTPDTLVVNFTVKGLWPILLCTDEGNCATDLLTIPNVDPGVGKRLTLSITIPADAPGQQRTSYGFQAVSSGSGSASSIVGVEVSTP